VGGVVDIIEDGKSGLLVPAHDPAAMAEAIGRIMNDTRLAAGITEAAYAKVKEKYSLQSMVENTLRVYREALTQNRILILKFSSLGDIILSTAGLAAIRRKFPRPDHAISFLVGAEYKDVLQRNPHIDELLVCDFKNRNRGMGGFLKLAKSLRKKNFDTVIDLQNNRKSHALAALSLSLHRYGYDNKKWSLLLNHTIKDRKDAVGPVPHQFKLLGLLGIESLAPRLELYPTDRDQKFVDAFLKEQWLPDHQAIVGINIGASLRWKTKVWPLRSIARLCEELNRRRILVAVTGTAGDCGRVKELVTLAPKIKLINACGRFTVNQLACLIKRCGVYISADSAPLHIAAAMQVPFVALFGPTDPGRHLPPSEKSIVLHTKLDCSPCYRSKCAKARCMEAITVEEVLAAVEQFMK
jgi:lipopolysaccharide heptosyltransferase II